MRIRYVYFLAVFVLSLSATAQQGDSIMIKKIADEIMTNGKAYENLRYLCKQKRIKLGCG